MPQVSVSEFITLGRVIASGQLLRYRGGEQGFTTRFEQKLTKLLGVMHNDQSNAVGLTVTFDRPEDAKAFAAQRGVERLIDTGRHVYTNWIPIIAQHDRMNPYKWANRQITYLAEMCSKTLQILERTCRDFLGARFPLPLVRMKARKLASSLS
jgi:hypothetical protein